MPAGQLMYFECPEAVAIRPSSDWPIWPTITRSSTVPRHRGAKTSVQTDEKSSRLLRNRWTNSSQVWGDENFLLVGRLSCSAKNQNRVNLFHQCDYRPFW